MLRPDRQEFLRLAGSKTATLVPVAKSISADLQTPVSAFLRIAQAEPHAFLLESVEGGEKIGRYTFLGARPYCVLTARGGRAEVEDRRGGRTKRVTHSGPVLPLVRDLLRQHRPAQVPGLPPFTGGAVGFVGYDLVRELERLPSHAKDDLGMPDAVFMFFDRLLAFDHLRHEIQIIAAADVRSESPAHAYARAVRDIERIERRLSSGLPRPPRRKASATGVIQPHANMSKAQFLAAVQRAKDYIAAGDAFQVVLSQRFDFPMPAAPFDVYRALRRLNPSPYMSFLRVGALHVVGASPEMLVRISAGSRQIEYRPIAGTRARGKDDAEDCRREQELRTDAKERAEHVMLVDLGRNDVGRVSRYGSVKVRDLMFVERYSHVMHLVSAVEGTLRPELDAFDALAACFPAGTLSGAPKVRAMEIIEDLEPTRRGLYGGSVLYADFAGNLDSCIAIRTLAAWPEGACAATDALMRKSGVKFRAYVQAGAGIVADSDPESEYQECVDKARALIRAVELAAER
jgi:anthranilate synthase component 1